MHPLLDYGIIKVILIESNDLRVDESFLTGESEPASKDIDDEEILEAFKFATKLMLLYQKRKMGAENLLPF